MKVTLSPKVREYVNREANYLMSGSPKSGRQFRDDLKRLRQSLSQFPEMGKFTEEFPVDGIYRFVLGPYLIDYEILETEILIFSIRHGRERPPRVELEDDFDLEEPNSNPGLK